MAAYTCASATFIVYLAPVYTTQYTVHVGNIYEPRPRKKTEKELRDEKALSINKKEIRKFSFNENKSPVNLNFRNEAHKRFYTTQMNN